MCGGFHPASYKGDCLNAEFRFASGLEALQKEKEEYGRRFFLVRFDETEYLSADIDPEYGRLFTAYCYDPDEVTYCCEVSPSYYLMPVYSYFSAARTDNDELRIEIEDTISRLNEPCYVHCSRVDKMTEVHKGRNRFDYEDEALEYYSGNWYL